MLPPPGFLFVTCQMGAERALKAELARERPDFRFAYSRPGFLTFKLPAEHALAVDFDLRSVFARAYGFSLGKATGGDPLRLAEEIWKLVGVQRFDRLHVWQRDVQPAGDHGYEPGPSDAARHTRDAILAPRLARTSLTPALSQWEREIGVERQSTVGWLTPTEQGHRVLDCVVVEPNEWWLGYHRAAATQSCWPGGYCPIVLPADAVSRAYLKMEEGLQWSGLPLLPGEACVEIGCSPGGASQALLNRGLLVTGIDPADVDPRVLAHPHFTYVKKRGADVRRREFRGTNWLMADINLAPNYTLDTVEAIVTHPEVHIRGLLLTLKLIEWDLAAEIPAYLERIRSWGFPRVQARQLQHNRQEICVAARRKDVE